MLRFPNFLVHLYGQSQRSCTCLLVSVHETYCGDIQFDSTIYSADNGSLHLEFHTDGSSNFRGFAFEVQALRKKATVVCLLPVADRVPLIKATRVRS